jgi:hypothetical protein
MSNQSTKHFLIGDHIGVKDAKVRRGIVSAKYLFQGLIHVPSFIAMVFTGWNLSSEVLDVGVLETKFLNRLLELRVLTIVGDKDVQLVGGPV